MVTPFCRATGLSWCGLCYANAMGRANHPGHNLGRPRPSRKVRYGQMAIRKPDPVADAGTQVRVSLGSAFATSHPVLWEYLTSTAYEDGAGRQPASLLVFVESGIVKLCLNDRDLSRTGWVSGPALEEALVSLELKLGDGSIDWRTTK